MRLKDKLTYPESVTMTTYTYTHLRSLYNMADLNKSTGNLTVAVDAELIPLGPITLFVSGASPQTREGSTLMEQSIQEREIELRKRVTNTAPGHV